MRAVLVDLLCNSPFYCGELTQALRRAGVEAQLASPRFYLEPRYLDGVPRPSWIRDLVVHASRPRALRLAVRAVEGSLNFAALLAHIRSRDYAVVHVQWVPLEGRSSPFMWILRRWCDHAGTLLVYTAHNAVPHDAAVDRAALRRDLDRAHLVIAQTEHIARQLRTDIGTETPVVVIPHGPLFADHPLPPRALAADRIGDPSPPVVLFQGLIRPYKGLDLLAEAWPIVRAAFPTATLLVVGKVSDADSRRHVDRVRSLAGVAVVDRYVPVPEMLDFYAVADLVVFPYRRISQSGALMTAIGLGRPTVVTPIDGFLEQVRGLESALVAEDVSGAALGRALVGGLASLDRLAAATEHDRTTIAMSPTGWTAVAAATLEAYTTNLRSRRRGRSESRRPDTDASN
jgi:glycosyltransferase involved in cell wall biosynthesis